MPDHCFCEAVRDQLVRQPVNAASGAAFLGVAILVLLVKPATYSAAHANVRTVRAYAVMYACATAVIGAGTMFYHASLTFWGQTIDVLGMYLIASFILLYNLARLRPLSITSASIMYLAANIVLLLGLVALPAARRYVFAALILTAIVLELMSRRSRTDSARTPMLAAALITFLGGFLMWIADITGLLCAPRSWFQGHAVWHVLSALAIWQMFLYLQSVAPSRSWSRI